MNMTFNPFPVRTRFDEGSRVRWYTSPSDKTNKGVVQRVLFDLHEREICYEVEFPGPEGVGVETHVVNEYALRAY